MMFAYSSIFFSKVATIIDTIGVEEAEALDFFDDLVIFIGMALLSTINSLNEFKDLKLLIALFCNDNQWFKDECKSD